MGARPLRLSAGSGSASGKIVPFRAAASRLPAVQEFLLQNLWLVVLLLGSGAVAAWPEIQKLVGGSNEIGTLEATRLLNQGTTLVLDVRDASEFAAGHLPRARNIPVKDLPGRLEEIGKYKERAVLVTCRSGPRAGAA